MESRSSEVYIEPECLIFEADDQSQHRVVLTVLNPYDFAVVFHVLCREVDKYVVGTQRGIIKPRHRFDLVIRHKDVRPCHFYRQDLFKIELFKRNKTKPFAERQFTAVLKPSRDENLAKQEEGLPGPPAYSPYPEEIAQRHLKQGGGETVNPGNVGYFLLLCFCVGVVFMLPYECKPDDMDWWPPFLRMNIQAKFILSFLMGLLVSAVWHNLR